MKKFLGHRPGGVFVLCAVAWLAPVASAQAALTNSDCVKCHESQPHDILNRGGKHKTDVGCQDCHEGHRPSSKNNIPECSDCHDGNNHFELKGCNGCHTNPHAPKDITLSGNITKACLTCHTEQIEQLTAQKSKHTAKACSSCHDVHGKIPSCTDCHKPHASDMAADTCGVCHKAHQPTLVTYGVSTPSTLCGSCHKTPLAQLTSADNKTKHSKLGCSRCHEQKHGAQAVCKNCHDVPHPAGIMAKFPRCGDCHKTAHDLNNWTASKKKRR